MGQSMRTVAVCSDGAHHGVSTSWDRCERRGGAGVAFFAGERAAAERIARRLFGHSLADWEYAKLAGAPRDAQVDVGASGDKLYIEMTSPVTAAYHAHYYVYRATSGIVLVNDGFFVSQQKLRGHGFGLRCFRRQAAAAESLGIDRIELVAGRGRNENGYYTWPRFGFDGLIPMRVRRLLPMKLEIADTLLDVMALPDGRAWWRRYGVMVHAAFDVAPGSRSRRVLECYVRDRATAKDGPKRNLESWAALSYRNAR